MPVKFFRESIRKSSIGRKESHKCILMSNKIGERVQEESRRRIFICPFMPTFMFKYFHFRWRKETLCTKEAGTYVVVDAQANICPLGRKDKIQIPYNVVLREMVQFFIMVG